MEQAQYDKYIDTYHKNMHIYQELHNYALDSMNKIIFVVSTGTLVLSISFVGYLKTHIHFPWILISCWFCLICAVGLNFFAQWVTQQISIRMKQLLNQELIDGFPNKNDFNKNITDRDAWMNKLKKWANRVNTSVLFFMIIGLLALLFFVGINLLAQNAILKDKQDILIPSPTSITNYNYYQK